eukprot:767782-Hanusia_phi.AAC.3
MPAKSRGVLERLRTSQEGSWGLQGTSLRAGALQGASSVEGSCAEIRVAQRRQARDCGGGMGDQSGAHRPAKMMELLETPILSACLRRFSWTRMWNRRSHSTLLGTALRIRIQT